MVKCPKCGAELHSVEGHVDAAEVWMNCLGANDELCSNELVEEKRYGEVGYFCPECSTQLCLSGSCEVVEFLKDKLIPSWRDEYGGVHKLY